MLKITHLIGEVVNVVPVVRICGRRCLVVLEEQLPGVFMSGFEEPLQGMVLLRIELP